jgi:hypothetical protein
MEKLDEISKENPFKVPEGYFEVVNSKIIAAATAKRKHAVLYRLRPYFPAAAAAALFILLSYTAVRLLVPHGMHVTVQETALINYLSPDINEYDIYVLEEEVNPVPANEGEPVADKTDIIEYLIINDVSTDDIYEFL